MTSRFPCVFVIATAIERFPFREESPHVVEVSMRIRYRHRIDRDTVGLRAAAPAGLHATRRRRGERQTSVH
jgi:hypothetical protein